VAAFALLDSTYKDKVKDENQLKEEEDEKHKLADKLFPLNTSTTRKEMTIVGWSPNLLQNASGQVLKKYAYTYSQSCIKRSPLGHRKSGLIRQRFNSYAIIYNRTRKR
jgi:hypothetical protein